MPAVGRSSRAGRTVSTFEVQHEKNIRILGLIRDDPGWALSRVLAAEAAEAQRAEFRADAVRANEAWLADNERARAAEAESLSVQQSFQVMANQCARAEAQRDTLAAALRDIEQRATTGQHAAMLARAALAVVAPPEEQP